jgi:hypothetical protein
MGLVLSAGLLAEHFLIALALSHQSWCNTRE